MPRALTSADFRLFLGQSGMGKSTLMRFQASGARRVLIHDPNGEAAWGACGVAVSDRGELARAMQARTWSIVWRGSQAARSEADMIAAYEWANRCALAAGDALVLWDEVDRFTTAGRLPPAAYEMVNAGRHRGLRVFAASRRIRRVSRDLSANAGRVLICRMREPGDLAWVKAAVSVEAARAAPTLPPYSFLDCREGGFTVKKAPFR
jgi:hypothetical protein